MTRMRWISLALLTILWAASPVAAQENVIGFFEGPNGGLNAGSGAIGMTGWALADTGVRRVTIQVDGVDIVEASYGGFRPIVEDDHPGFPDSAGAGFGIQFNSTDFSNGLHYLSAKVETFGGSIVILPALAPTGQVPDGRLPVHFTNNTSILAPFGRINVPQRNANLIGTCDRNNSIRYTVVSGWALDLGVELHDAGVGWVEVMVDGVILANSRTGCFYNTATGGLTNCYGLQRLDIERSYPFALDAPNSGFRFVLDIGELLNNGWVQGHHTLGIRAGDLSNQSIEIDEIPVNFLCAENNGNEPSFGFIETPRPGRQWADLINFQGWALDFQGVAAVEIFVDGTSIGLADFGAGLGGRPGVLSRYPGYPDSLSPVWRLSNFDTTNLSEGFHQVQAQVTDDLGATTIIGETTFFVNNVVD